MKKGARHFSLIVVVYCCLSTSEADIKVDCQGAGPALYLIGGGPAFTTWNLQPIQNRLRSHYRVCRWDMRGVGDNAGLAVEPRVSVLSQWLRDMHDVLPQEPVLLWGHSWGALQILLFAEKSPERVTKLILSNPVDPALRSLEHIEQKRFNHPDTGKTLEPEDMGTLIEERHNLRSKIASYFVDADKGWEYAAGFTQEDANGALNVTIWDEYRSTPLSDVAVRKLSRKIGGVIYCQSDVLQPENLAEYRRLLHNVKHHVLTGCSHFPWEENPENYYQVLLRVIRESQEQTPLK